MNKTLSSLLFSSILLAAPSSLHAQYLSQVWNPDNGNGTYTNPMIYADYSDPDVVAVGEDWFLHFNDKYAYGRVIFLQPVNWKTGWPVIGNDKDGDGCGEPYITYRKPKSTSHIMVNPQESDEFNSTELGLQWQWHANYDQLWGMPSNNGCLRLYTADLSSANAGGKQEPFKSLWEAGNLLLQKTPAKSFKATA